MTISQQNLTTTGQLQGLSQAEVVARRERGEANVAPVETSRSYLRIIRENVFSLINVVLYVIAIVLVALGLYGDALVTGGLVLVNVLVGVVQETRAKRQLDRIALLTRPQATVIREGREETVDPSQIVLGDLVVAEPGDQILVDGTVIQGQMHADESLLTGESDAVPKGPGDPVYSGSFAVSGRAIYEANNVGAASLAQRITSQARAYREVKTPLQREVGLVLRVMLVVAVALGVEVALSYRQLYQGLPLAESVQAAAVIAGLVPQGLVLMVAITYAMAAVRMAGSGALIQRMNAVESTSHIDTLCLDKTGTLTTNQLKLHALRPIGIDEQDLRARLGTFTASVAAGNRTNDAIQAACPGAPGPVREEVAFSSARKWSALALDTGGAVPGGIYVLGAPDVLRPALRPGSLPEDAGRDWTSQGLRVLLLAFLPEHPPLHDPDKEPVLPTGLTPLGLIALSDELRPEARETIAAFGEAGIELKIISGDDPETVASLARQAGLPGPVRSVSGLDLRGYGDEALDHVVQDNAIFGRITPEQKEQLVRALRRRGRYVAMIGDGVNDVLALKQAHLAVAMRSGSAVTRNVADIVLLHDSFAALPRAFQEGRRIRRGMGDIIRLFLVRTLYTALIILAASLLGLAFPIIPRQNAMVAFLTVGIPTFALAAWATPGTTPRRLVPSASRFIIPAALTIAGLGLTVYIFNLQMGSDVATARTSLTLLMTACGLLLILFVQPPSEAWVGAAHLNGDWRVGALVAGLFGLFVASLVVPLARSFYELTILHWTAYVLIALVVIGWATVMRWLWRLPVRPWLATARARLPHVKRRRRRW